MDRATATRLLDALSAWRGIVCVVGAGGKKTTLHRLVEAHEAVGTERLALTCTVAMAPPDHRLAPLVIGTPDVIGEHMRTMPRIAYAAPSTKLGRLGAMPPERVRALHDAGGFAVTLVKADGARMRAIKAPGLEEPVLPAHADVVVPVVSAEVMGLVLDERIAHRLEVLSAVVGARPGTRLSAEHVGRLLASPDGSLKGTAASGRVVPVINRVDDPERLDRARAAAAAALATTDRFDRVVLAQMTADDPVIEIATRTL